MNDTLYIHIRQNINVNHPHIYLQDIATLSCSNSNILNKLRVLPIVHFQPDQSIRYPMSVIDLILLIQKKEPNLTISLSGESDFIITYQKTQATIPLWQWCKTVFVCLTVFFGSAFSIMAFYNDVDIGKLFSEIYYQVTGNTSNHFTLLEIAYSVGIGIGVLFFFHHFKKNTKGKDPSPMQIQLNNYEEDVNKTLLNQ